MTKILLVDDSRTVLLMEQMILAGEPYTFELATNGEEALARATANPPDLVLLDVIMPGLDGFEVCRRLRAHASTRAVPIIMVTTRAEGENVEEGYESGCTDYVAKPIHPEELLAKVRNYAPAREASLG